MKQLQYCFSSEMELRAWLTNLRDTIEAEGSDPSRVFFSMQTTTKDQSLMEPVVDAVRQIFPGAPYIGGSGNGNIIRGEADSCQVAVIANIAEDPETRVEVLQLPMTHETQAESARRLIEEVEARPWVKTIEMITTIQKADIPQFCHDIAGLPAGIHVSGGGVLAQDAFSGLDFGPYVFSSAGEISHYSTVFVLMGGPGIYVDTQYIMGWHGLGQSLQITDADKNVLKEINGRTAIEVYDQYLQLPKGDRFFEMSVVFPFAIEEHGVPCLRVATAYDENGYLYMGADIHTGMPIQVAYGDPEHILRSISETLYKVRDFQPDLIRIYSCASRQYFWGDEVSQETQPFQQLAPTSGFFTSGEFLRINGAITMHNVSMIVASVREGLPKTPPPEEITEARQDLTRQTLVNRCLCTFINATTGKLIEANALLSRMAITDGLTGLYNRMEIEKRIRIALRAERRADAHRAAAHLIMVDMDNFKHINDTYGHQEGDRILKVIAEIFIEQADAAGLSVSAGRWGGEEFMLLAECCSDEEALELAESIRLTMESYYFPASGTHTMSCGVTRVIPGESLDTVCLRVDNGLYQAKREGKNRTVVI